MAIVIVRMQTVVVRGKGFIPIPNIQFCHICDTLLGLTPGNILLLAFDHQGWESTMDLDAVTDATINTMTYEACGGVTIIPPGHRDKVCISFVPCSPIGPMRRKVPLK
jgi:hypothetical protein